MNPTVRQRIVALAYGVACHGLFLVAVALMVEGLLTGMQSGRGRLTGAAALLANAALLLQFPVIHSLLLTRRGIGTLSRLAPKSLGRTLTPTTYALIAALQIGATFLLWSPSGVVSWRPEGAMHVVQGTVFALAWVFLAKALFDAGPGLQTGWIGWTSAWQGRKPRYPGLPQAGLFARCRQPIYFGFALILWTGPVWTPDHLAIAVVWSTYCVVGPLHKERRFAAIYGKDFEAYSRRVPYLIPKLFS